MLNYSCMRMAVSSGVCNIDSSMDEKQLIKLIEKYLSGQCSEEEKTQVEQWYASSGQEQPAFFNGDAQLVKDSADRSLKAIRERLAVREQVDVPEKQGRRRIIRLSSWAAAACVLVCVSVIAGFYLKSSRSAGEYTVLSTSIGEVKEWKLPDGSSVWLNAGSSIRFPAGFNEQTREVYLEGEAFFDVVQEVNKPFIIHSGKLNTRVLGTAFTVSAYPGAALSTITVLQGEVQVSDASHVLGNLVADRKIEYRNDIGKSTVAGVDATKDVAWKERKLVFTDLPMSDISIHLERWYGYRFHFENRQLKDVRFTASFANTISLPDLLKLMKEASHVEYRLDHQTKTVTFL
ncbi:FecR domain-containing protein [Chitinophaga sp. YIM B06452]|uniref:FecR family protein n=1 Tax=Chitinophaga sp. YIM B06452 TaxID=3082158 RepID=UPI0031FEAE3D